MRVEYKKRLQFISYTEFTNTYPDMDIKQRENQQKTDKILYM